MKELQKALSLVTLPLGQPQEHRRDQRTGTETLTGVLSLLLALVLQQVLTCTLPVTNVLGFHSGGLLRRRSAPATSGLPPLRSAASLVTDAAPGRGLGILGPGANGFMRAVVVELLRDSVTVVISRNELNRLFEGDLDIALRQSVAPQLQVYDLLEDTIEALELQLELQRLLDGPTNPIVWIATPGDDDDVVLPLIEQGSGHGLSGLMFGDWRHGPTYVIDTHNTVTETYRDPERSCAVGTAVTALTSAEAITRLNTQEACT